MYDLLLKGGTVVDGVDPYTQAQGIRLVFVNGIMSLADGEVTSAFAGKVLRRR